MKEKNLVTIKRASEITGASTSFFKQLLRERKLVRYKINTATYISMSEFENIAQAKV
jgi:predicted HTH domain antitoxin